MAPPWRDGNRIFYVGETLTDETNECCGFLPVPGAVHGLECKDIFLHGEGEHVVAVVLPVARCLPQFAVVNVWGGHFLEASSPVLLLDKWQNHINKLKSPVCLHRYFTELSSWLLQSVGNFVFSFSFSVSYCFQISSAAVLQQYYWKDFVTGLLWLRIEGPFKKTNLLSQIMMNKQTEAEADIKKIQHQRRRKGDYWRNWSSRIEVQSSNGTLRSITSLHIFTSSKSSSSSLSLFFFSRAFHSRFALYCTYVCIGMQANILT